MRPVSLFEKPNFPPYVCVYCGVGQEPRKWFIDPGFSLDYYFNPVNDGTLFICDECWRNLVVQVERLVNQYTLDHDAWDSPDRVTPTYNWKEETKSAPVPPVGVLTSGEGENSDVRESEPSGSEPVSEGNLKFGTGTDQESERDDSSAEPDDTAIESTANSADVAAYTAIFGEQPEPESS